MNLVQIPFSGFKAIKLLQNVNLELYQALFDDQTEPVGIVSTIQAFGLLKPTDASIDMFNHRWNLSTARWKLKETGIEIATGKSTTTTEMMKTADGEVTLMILSFLLDSLAFDGVNEITRCLIDATPQSLVPLKPRRAQITNLLKAVQSQVSGIDWRDQMEDAEKTVGETQLVWHRGLVSPKWSFELPTKAIAAYYQALCTVTRFPEYHCVLETNGSLSLAYALAGLFCGLRVCVVVGGQVIHGSCSAGQWQVRLERVEDRIHTKVKIGRKIDDIQDLLVVEEVSNVRANRIPLKGIGKAATVGQGLSQKEAEELAACATCIATRALRNMKREPKDYSDDDNESVDYGSTSSTPQEDENPDLVPVQTQVSIDALALWWDCSNDEAKTLRENGIQHPMFLGDQKRWDDIRFGKQVMGKIAKFETLDKEAQIQLLLRIPGPCSRDDYTKLLHVLTSQIILISFLEFNDISRHQVRVRSGGKPHNTLVGRGLQGTMTPSTLGQTDIMASWYYWLQGTMPKDLDCVETLSTDGFLIYRRLLLDLNLEPLVCEKIIVEPGHILFDKSRSKMVIGDDQGYMVVGHPQYRKLRSEPFELKPSDKTRKVDRSWNVTEADGVLELGLHLNIGDSVSVDTSIYAIALASWKLSYGGRALNCSHGSDTGSLVKGETIEELTPGNGPEPEPETGSAQWTSMKLFRAHGNNLGQIACLMSTEKRGMVRTEACLRCCLSAAQTEGLDFLID
ncbi:hypothetical protein BGZ57DRAFT_936615 [Hyaloscypha finlandica]|nr:hypothetical protein BGZ57DRAFT_936615 [Hyaloscypha finlandica]